MIGEAIRLLREDQKLSQADFARKTGISQSYLSAVERNLKSPGSEILVTLKSLFNINSDWLLTGEGEMYAEEKKASPKPEKAPEENRLTAIENELKELKKARLTPPELAEQVQIPLYQHAVSAGPACTVSEEVEEYMPVPKKIARHPRNTFAVRVSGDSMIGAGIEEGDIIICDARGTYKTGSIVVASIDGGQTLKKIQMDKGTVTLKPANHNHDTIPITDNSDLSILGVVIAIFRILEQL